MASKSRSKRAKEKFMITIVIDVPGATTGQYDEACKVANVGPGTLADGCIFHCAQQTENGLLVVDVWRSEEEFRAFGEILMPAITAVGFPEIHPKIYRTHAILDRTASLRLA